MSRKRIFARGPSAYRRGRLQFPSSGKAFLIVTEGEKTEPNYLTTLRDRLQLNVVEVEIVHPNGTDPITLTQKAIALRAARKKAARNGFQIPYDEVWVVFDLEKPHDERRKLAEQAISMKEAVGIRFAVSDPCFEFWLLLHGEYTTSPFVGCEPVVKRLKKHWDSYAKGQKPVKEFLEKIPTAVANAQGCRQHHQDCAGNGNPSTRVDLLVRSLNSATRSHLQFLLA